MKAEPTALVKTEPVLYLEDADPVKGVDLVQRIRELAVQSANATNSTSDRALPVGLEDPLNQVAFSQVLLIAVQLVVRRRVVATKHTLGHT